MKRSILLSLAICSALAAGVALGAINRPAGGHPDGLLDYQVDTIRAKRIEIMGERWDIRMVLTVHQGRPAITFYTESGEPAEMVWVEGAGLITQRR